MRTIIEATLVLTVSLFVTLFILVALFARHPLGASEIAFNDPVISPAVLIEDAYASPGRNGVQIQPRTHTGAGSEQCPFLAALAAASACPAAPESTSAPTCPYLREVHRQHLDAHSEPVRVSGQDI